MADTATLATLIDHALYALLLLALLVPKPSIVRLLILGFAALGLARILWLAGYGEAMDRYWLAGLAAAALLLLVRSGVRAARVSFSPEEELLLARLIPGVPRRRARHMLDQGLWLEGKRGDRLTIEGKPVEHLYFLSEGEARVLSGGKPVGLCREGDLIGEVTVLTGEPASATVILSTDARFWCANAAKLRPYLKTHDDLARAVERSIAEALKAKLRASNRIIAESGGVQR